jgi:putative peptidoglycan lipid II flippase
VPWLDHAGLALATSFAAVLNALLLLFGLRRRGAWRPLPGWWRLFAQVAAGAGALAVLLAITVPMVDWTGLGAQPLRRMVLVLGLVAAGATLYLLTLLVCGLRPRHFLRRET